VGNASGTVTVCPFSFLLDDWPIPPFSGPVVSNLRPDTPPKKVRAPFVKTTTKAIAIHDGGQLEFLPQYFGTKTSATFLSTGDIA
jgi:hypothetical protein